MSTPFADTLIRSRTECPTCGDLCLEAVSKNGKTMLMDIQPVKEKKRGATGWAIGLEVIDGATKFRARFLNPFDREYALQRNQEVYACHYDRCKKEKS